MLQISLPPPESAPRQVTIFTFVQHLIRSPQPETRIGVTPPHKPEPKSLSTWKHGHDSGICEALGMTEVLAGTSKKIQAQVCFSNKHLTNSSLQPVSPCQFSFLLPDLPQTSNITSVAYILKAHTYTTYIPDGTHPPPRHRPSLPHSLDPYIQPSAPPSSSV